MLEKITYKNFHSMLNRFSTKELEGLVQKFPYFQQGHLLLAKKYQLENNPRFDEQLQLAALYTQNRELLYDLFTKPVLEKSVGELPAEVGVEKVIAVQEDLLEEVTPVVEPAPEVASDFSTENLSIVVAEEPDKTEQAEGAVPELEIIATETVTVLPEVEAVAPNNLSEETYTEPAELNNDLTEEPRTYDEWIRAYSYDKSVVDEVQPTSPKQQETDEPDELEELITANVSVDYLHNMVEEETHYSKGLDRFIEEQIKKHRPAEPRPQKDENTIFEDIITETLARLYENQRKYHKAIRAYEVLGIKFPEKNDLFAARIQYLKKLI